jgi:undecaprenyl-diphosphatase
MNDLIDVLAGLASPWGYVFVGVLAMLESAAFIGLVIPGETVLLVGGLLAYQGRASVVLMMVVAAAGAIVGDSIGYEIGRAAGPSIRDSRLGKKVGARRWAAAERYLNRHGGSAVLLGRFVSLLRALVPTIAGLTHMRYRTFLVWNAAGGVLWAPIFVTLGYVAGSSFRHVQQVAGRVGSLVVLVLCVVLGIAVIRRVRHRGSHPARTPH